MKFKTGFEGWRWRLMLKSELDIWSWILKYDVEVEVLSVMYKVKAWSWSMKFTVRDWSLQMTLWTDRSCQGLLGLFFMRSLLSLDFICNIQDKIESNRFHLIWILSFCVLNLKYIEVTLGYCFNSTIVLYNFSLYVKLYTRDRPIIGIIDIGIG